MSYWWDIRQPVRKWARKQMILLGSVTRQRLVTTQQNKKISTLCCELQRVWISGSVIVTYSYDLQVFMKSNYQSNPRLWSFYHVTIYLIIFNSMYCYNGYFIKINNLFLSRLDQMEPTLHNCYALRTFPNLLFQEFYSISTFPANKSHVKKIIPRVITSR
jgi:hypothetical protein